MRKPKYPLSYVMAYVREVRRTSPNWSIRNCVEWAFTLIEMDEKDYRK